MKKTKVLTSLLFCAIATGSLSLSQAAPDIGDVAPDFTLVDTGGVEHPLSDYSGKVIVLEWITNNCPYVEKHYGEKNMQGLQKNYVEEGVVWFSISSTAPGKDGYLNPDSWNKLLEEYDSSATALLMDPSGEVGRRYGARTSPHIFIIGADGLLAYSGAVDTFGTTDPADIVRATNWVEQALDAILAGEPVKVPSTNPYGCAIKN